MKENASSGLKQILKSCTFVVSVVGCIGLCGAWLAKKGPVGSLTGMGIGAVIGSVISRFINKRIDKK